MMPSGVGISISVDTSGLSVLIRSLRDKEIPTAARNTLNDVARDVVKRERQEIKRVFDRPTPLIQKSPRAILATKEKLVSAVWLKDVFVSGTQAWSGDPIFKALTPHIPGYPAHREQKGMEGWAKHAGLMKENEWLMPARVRLDIYGNVTGSLAQKMLADINAYRNVAGMPSATHTKKRKYVWGTSWKKGETLRGIWSIKTTKGGKHYHLDKLMMMVVSKAPVYTKRFRFHDVARLYAQRIIRHHADLAIEHAIRRRRAR